MVIDCRKRNEMSGDATRDRCRSGQASFTHHDTEVVSHEIVADVVHWTTVSSGWGKEVADRWTIDLFVFLCCFYYFFFRQSCPKSSKYFNTKSISGGARPAKGG